MFDSCQLVNELVPYEVFSSHMKQFNIEQKILLMTCCIKKVNIPQNLYIYF
jgi:hypothetical protein